MATETGLDWSLEGALLVACNCDYGCPCNFNALPTQGKCEGQWTWHVRSGHIGDTRLDGLTFTLAVNWPGAIHEGGGEALLLLDERADEAQTVVIQQLVSGEVGGPWALLAWTWPTLHGPERVRYELSLDGLRSSVRGGQLFELEIEPIRNPVTGAEITPGAVLPQGLVFRRADFGSSAVFRVGGPAGFEHPGKYTAVGDFAYPFA